MSELDLEEKINKLINIASSQENFKYSCYQNIGREDWFDVFVLEEAPMGYNLDELIKEIKEDLR